MISTMVDKYRSWIKEETTNLLKRYAVAMGIPSRSFNLCVWCVQHRSPMPPAFLSRTSLLPQHGCSRAMVGFCSQFACSVVGVHAFRKQRLVFFHTQLFLTGSKVHMKCNWCDLTAYDASTRGCVFRKRYVFFTSQNPYTWQGERSDGAILPW